jgi:hypothetical protein
VEPRQGDPVDGRRQDPDARDSELGAVHVVPAVAIVAVEEEGSLVGPARPPVVVDGSRAP